MLRLALAFLIATALPGTGAPVDVHDFGAVGDGATDDGPAIRAALRAAVDASQRDGRRKQVVRFDPGRVYYVGPWSERWHTLPIIGGRDIVVDGRGAELRISRKNMAFDILRSEAITIRNFIIDYDPLPFTQGEVETVDAESGTFTWRLEDGYPAPPQEDIGYDHGCFIDPAPSRKYTHYWVYVEAVTPVEGEPGLYTIHPRDSHRDVVRNWAEASQRFWFFLNDRVPDEYEARFVYDKRGHCQSAPAASIALRHSPDCVIENVEHYSSPRMTIRYDGCDDLVLRNIRVIRRPGTTRLCAGNSDGFHGRTRSGPIIENCEFEALGDDSIATGSMAHRVWMIDSPTRLRLAYTDIAWYPLWMDPGDRFRFWDQVEGKDLGEAAVVKVEPVGSHDAYVTLDRPIEGLRALADLPKEGAAPEAQCTLAFRVPDKPMVIRKCTFRTQLKEAMLIGGRLVVQDNDIEDTAYGIDGYFFGRTVDGIFRRNRIRGAWPYFLGLRADPSGNPLKPAVEGRIVIEDNEFEIRARGKLPVHYGLMLEPFSNVTIRGNGFQISADANPDTQAVVLRRCRDVLFEDNVFDDARPKVNGGVVHLVDMAEEDISMGGNVYHMRPGVNPVHRAK